MNAFVAGRLSKFAVLGLWLVLATVGGLYAARLVEVQNNDALSALPATAETTKALDRLEAAFPGSNRLTAVVVYARDDGLTAADRAAVDTDRAAFARYAEGGRPPEVQPSGDGKALLMAFPLAGDTDAQEKATEEVHDLLADGLPAGLRTGLTGSAGANMDVFDAFAGMDSTLLLTTAGVVVLILLFTYRSPVLWLLPLLAVGVASQVASAAVYLLAKHAGVAVDFQSQSVLTVIVFGVGVDYALLLIARYREELRRHEDRHAAMRVALLRSSPAILASAATVAIALLCLLAADLPATRGLGPVVAVGVVAAFAAMTTLLPALLVLCGRWLFWPFVPRHHTVPAQADPGRDGPAEVAEHHRGWARVARGVGRFPTATWLGTAAALAILCLGIGNLGVGLPGAEVFTKEVGSVRGQELIDAHYAGGTSAPATVLAAAARGDAVVAAARAVDGVASVGEPVADADGRWVRIDAVLAGAPDTDDAKRVIERLRTAVHAVSGADALVGGPTAAELDTETVSARDDRVVIPLILLVVFVILVLLLRSLVAPLVLLASVVLSYAAAMGAAGFILDAMGYPELYFGLPLQAFLFLVALGVDYSIFLMTRAREEVAAHGHREGILRAVTVTGGVITSAGVVLAATFASLAVLPLTPSVQNAVVVSVGVLLDTFLIRSLLVPALALSIGPAVWWPSRLGRRGGTSGGVAMEPQVSTVVPAR
ncbi:MMPL family transporter [Virgisporangium ochraceum]|uniref:Membrane protein n=1 Tax=Virgisporangium ochraceum TaxID=65505 RepID=A0A8J3ZNV1_9ACTN|nr:MMPL family transporter [Virgisporangium ochraceum]GIJ67442.1 membrane protein [Virgisporangium ochraceum]